MLPTYLCFFYRILNTSRLTEPEVIFSNADEATSVDFYYADQAVFWADITTQKIYRTFINNGKKNSTTAIIKHELGTADGLGVDWITSKLYWTDSTMKRIEVSNLDGKYRKVLFWANLESPRSLALDPLNG